MKLRHLGIVVLWALIAFVPCRLLSAQDHRGLEVVAQKISAEVPGRQIVFLIAVDKYREWTPLKNPVRDARQIADIIARRYFVDERIELYDEDATRVGILRRFESLIGELKPEDSVLIYYAGHGQLDSFTDTGFWIPQDAGTDSYEQRNWLSNQQIRNLIAKMKSRHVVLVSDACFSGDILNPSRGALPQINDEYFRTAYARRSRQVLTSGSSETVPDESSFSRAFKLALEDNRKPYLDPIMIFNEVRLSVKGTTPLFGTLNGTDHQEGGSFILFLKEAQVQPPPSTGTTPTTVQDFLGSLVVRTKTAGTLYIDGKASGDLRAGGARRLSGLDVGWYELEMRYALGESEKLPAQVEEGKEKEVGFSWTPPPATTTSTTTTTTTIKPAGKSLVEMVPVQGGSFMMGSESGNLIEKPVHRVTVSSFLIGKYEVTQEQYERVIKINPSYFASGFDALKWPVEQVSWYDSVIFCNGLSELEGLQKVYTISSTDVRADLSRNGYRLPTEAEWEYAARGGNQTRNYLYSGSNDNVQVAWYGTNSGHSTHVVGTRAPNELGLYDMSGNVWEWCWDWYGDYLSGQQSDPQGANSNSNRILRGGSWGKSPDELRSTYRHVGYPSAPPNDIGFRVARRP